MEGEQAVSIFLWIIGIVLVGIFYVAVILIADRAGKILKLLTEVRDHLAATRRP